jgi:hypothetical protein
MIVSLARGAVYTIGGLGALLAGGLACIAATVGVCAAVGLLLYGAAHLFAYLIGFDFIWGLVTACWLLLMAPVVGALAHDVWMIRRLATLNGSATTDL